MVGTIYLPVQTRYGALPCAGRICIPLSTCRQESCCDRLSWETVRCSAYVCQGFFKQMLFCAFPVSAPPQVLFTCLSTSIALPFPRRGYISVIRDFPAGLFFLHLLIRVAFYQYVSFLYLTFGTILVLNDLRIST